MRINSNGVVINVEVTGPDEGPAVILLHGFPDSGHLWAAQVEALSAAGYRVIVPDQRGYGQSGKPSGIEAYNISLLVADVAAVLDQLGVRRAHVVGHDWGAAVAWTLAARAPNRVDHLVALSVGHPAAPGHAGMEQREKSWYMLLFHFPGIAEQWLSADGWTNFRQWSRHPRADEVIAELQKNGSLTPGLNWYRANRHPRTLIEPPPALPPITAPTMGIWSSGDFALTEKQMTDSAAQVTGPWRYERLDGPGHWLQIDADAEVNRLLLDFLGS